MFTLSKTHFYYKYLILALYLGAFEMIFRGLLRKIGLEPIATILIQGYIYILPFFFLFIHPVNSKIASKLTYFLIFIQAVYLLLIVMPFSIESGSIKYFFVGLKNFYFPLMYFIVFYYLIDKKECFVERFFGHVLNIGICFGIYTIFEFLSLYLWQNDLFYFVNSLTYNPGFRSEYFLTYARRPTGLYGSMQQNGFFFAVLASFCMHKRFKFWCIDAKYFFCFFLLCLLLSTAKTYIFVFLLYFVISTLFSLKSKRNITILLVFLLSTLGAAVLFRPILDYYNGIFFNIDPMGVYGSHTIPRMIDKLSEFKWFLKESILPKGFVPNVDLDSNIVIPEIYRDQEVFLYGLSYQIGVLGTLLWIFTIFRPMFTTRIRWIFKSEYAGMFFIAIFGFMHYQVIHTSFLFLIAIFCNIMALQQLNHSRYKLAE